MRFRRLVVLAFAGAALVGSGTGSGASTPECSTSGPLICADLVGMPATVSPSGAGSPHYVSYVSQVSNEGSQTATHVTANVAFTGGLELVSATSSAGSCSVGADPICALGRIASGAKATVEFVARAPAAEGDATATLIVSFDERSNDGPTSDPKQDTVEASEDTTILAESGTASSFVPKGASVSLTTDATGSGIATASDPLIGDAEITSAPTPVVALIQEVAAPVSCPKGVVCRGGDWLHADIPGTFDPPLAFAFRWDSSIVPSSLTTKKFAVLYTECLNGCPLQVISKRCGSASPAVSELPCLTDVAKLRDGDWVGILLNSHNGYMR